MGELSELDDRGRLAGIDEVIARVRRAGPADNAALLELMGHVPMEGALALATRRDPDFFSLYAMQRGDADTLLYDDGRFAAMGSLLVRDGWLDGRAQPVGYLGDLRLRGGGRARRAFPRLYQRFFADNVERTGCEAYLTAILASNAVAVASLAGKAGGAIRGTRAPQPSYHLLRRFDLASVQLLWRRRPRPVSGVEVTTATPDDVPALAAFLAADHRARPFGYRFDDGELEHRLARWPGFSLADTFVARAAGRIVGVCTAWDAAPVKRYRVMRYGREMRAARLGVALAAAALGCPRLPRVGEDFRSLYLTNLSVAGDSPVVLRALLERVYARAWDLRVHFFSLPLYEDDPLAAALSGFVVRRLPFLLYGVTARDRARTLWPSGRPGFEAALA